MCTTGTSLWCRHDVDAGGHQPQKEGLLRRGPGTRGCHNGQCGSNALDAATPPCEVYDIVVVVGTTVSSAQSYVANNHFMCTTNSLAQPGWSCCSYSMPPSDQGANNVKKGFSTRTGLQVRSENTANDMFARPGRPKTNTVQPVALRQGLHVQNDGHPCPVPRRTRTLYRCTVCWCRSVSPKKRRLKLGACKAGRIRRSWSPSLSSNSHAAFIHACSTYRALSRVVL